jgi:hypothetical protein
MSSLLIVRPLHDELAHGHLGRIGAVTKQTSLRALGERLCKELLEGERERRTLPVLPALAKAAAMSTYDYVHRHTLLPFLKFSSKSVPTKSEDEIINRLVLRTSWNTSRKHGYFCSACAKEDVDKRGYSYWRREHQLPARFYCSLHPNEVLRQIPASQAFLSSPCHWLKESECSNLRSEMPPKPDATTARFHEISRAMLDTPLGHDIRAVRANINKQAKVRQLYVAKACRRAELRQKPTLSALAIEQVQESVLEAIFPGYRTDPTGGKLNQLTSICQPCSQGTPLPEATALGLAILFPTANTALAAVTAKPNPNERPRVKVHRVLAALCSANGNVAKASEDLQMPHPELSRLLSKKYNRNRLLAESKEVCAGIDMFMRGDRISDASKKANVDCEYFESWLRLLLGIRTPKALTSERGRALGPRQLA